MNRISLCVSLLITTSIIAQKTVKWSTSFDETKQQVNFNAKIEKGWHLYAIYVPLPDDGPLPTIIKYKTRMGKGRDFKYVKNLNTDSDESDWSYPLLGKEDYSKIIPRE